ncbi:hypothetical protein B9H04_06955 [Halorubrum ezzemoulense DSM 17463]|uniref:Uncharacterized protein n=1 Tax=Halorubrum ezzemoulense DSM 17463 TaxID=1121945 RepID=A0A1X4H8P2_HALEZ|nr:hypothetical protein B9H04_06955 [Halorubrum ezzemoulense DSM 17463]
MSCSVSGSSTSSSRSISGSSTSDSSVRRYSKGPRGQTFSIVRTGTLSRFSLLSSRYWAFPSVATSCFRLRCRSAFSLA